MTGSRIASKFFNLQAIRWGFKFGTANKMEMMTVAELAAMLKMSKGQVYEMTKERTRTGAMRDNPLPFLKVNGNVRFLREDVEEWIKKLAAW